MSSSACARQPLPSVADAKRAHAAGKATFDEQFTLLLHFARSRPETVHAVSLGKEAGAVVDTFAVTITFESGAIGQVLYAGNGDPAIAVGTAPNGIAIYPATLQPGEMEIITNRLAELLG